MNRNGVVLGLMTVLAVYGFWGCWFGMDFEITFLVGTLNLILVVIIAFIDLLIRGKLNVRRP